MFNKELFRKKEIRTASIVLAVIVVILVVFQSGMYLGEKRAAFSGRFGDNYYRAFGEHPDRMSFSDEREMPNAHGAAGKIVSIALPHLVVADRDGTEKTVAINEKTDIKRFRDSEKPETLRVDDFIIVIGSPNESGEIDAKLIRMLPPPTDLGNTVFGSTSSSTR